MRSVAVFSGSRFIRGVASRGANLKLPWMPVTIVTALLVCAAFAPWLAPHDPTSFSILDSRISPFESMTHPLGTDMLGRDILSRLIYGARSSVLISMSALGTGLVIGTVLGITAGYAGRWVDVVIMRVSDAVLGFPSVLVAMIVVALLGTGLQNVILAVAATTWPRFTRMVRGETIGNKHSDYVTFANIIGVPSYIVVWKHLFPNVVNTLIITTSLIAGEVILLEASLSFLGLGFPPGAPAWGIMVAEGRQAVLQAWWLSLFPGAVIMTVVMALNFFGDWLRDRLDPKLRRL
jgi:peptide/nickel transport system permease protein